MDGNVVRLSSSEESADDPIFSNPPALAGLVAHTGGISPAEQHAIELRRERAAHADEILMEQIALERSDTAFSEFYDRFSPRVYALLLHMLRSEEDAQDLLQEIFVLIWQKAPLYLESRGSVASWVVALARNRAVDELRSKRYRERSQESELVIDEERPTILHVLIDSRLPDSDLHSSDVRREVQSALLTLTPDQRSVVDLAYFGGMTHTEIADKLKMPIGTVKTRLRQAVIKMGELLKPRF